MRQLVKFVLLSLTATVSSSQESCTKPYEKFGSKCLALTINDKANFRETTCTQGLKGTIGHFDSDAVNEMASFLKKAVDKALQKNFFIGITYRTKTNDFKGKKKWRYIDSDEEIGDDYPLWAEDEPKNGRDCAVISTEKNYRVAAEKCRSECGYICFSKSEDCGGQSYMNSDGLCVHAVNGHMKFDEAVNECRNEDQSILIPLKDESELKKIIPAIHTSEFKGGICMDLEEKDGQWTYRDGTSPPADLWDDRVPRKWDCGAIKIMEDWSIKLHTLKCTNDFQCLCHEKG